MRKQYIWCCENTLFALLVCVFFAFSTASYADITYYHLDALGSPIGATDATGAVIWRASYYPYGDKTVTPLTPGGITDAAENTRWYTAHVDDFDTGLTYMEARYYDPVIGRFMGVDPVGFLESNPASFNRYLYVNNNPYKYVDPDGELFQFAIIPAIISLFAVSDYANAPAEQSEVQAMSTVDAALEFTGLNKAQAAGKGIKAATNSAGTKRNPNKLASDDRAEGPHSTFRRGDDGRVTNYETYDRNPKTGEFGAEKRYRGEGKRHGGVEPPLVLERAPGKGPGARPNVPRPAEPWEIPGGGG